MGVAKTIEFQTQTRIGAVARVERGCVGGGIKDKYLVLCDTRKQQIAWRGQGREGLIVGYACRNHSQRIRWRAGRLRRDQGMDDAGGVYEANDAVTGISDKKAAVRIGGH